MAQLYSTVTAAARLGVDKSTVSRHAAKLKLGQRIGRNLVLSDRDLAKIRKALKGNSNG